MGIEDQIPPEIQTAVRRYVRNRLHVSLSQSDGTSKNQDALQLVQDVLVNFIEDRERADDPVGYAVGIARRRVQDYFGTVKIVYTRLQDRLRYYLRNTTGFALWQEQSGEWVCGCSGWTGGRKGRADTAVILEVKASPQMMKIRSFPTGDIDLLDRQDWHGIFEGIFNWFDSTVPFSEFIRIVCGLLQISEYVYEPIVPEGGQEQGEPPTRQFPSPEPDPHRMLNAMELLAQLWREIQSLLPRQRVAYLLNPPDDETEILINSGVASQTAVRTAIGLSQDQYKLLWQELAVDSTAPSVPLSPWNDDEAFAQLRSYLPIEDLIIAKLLVCTRNQIIGLRSCARQRLQRRMAAFREGNVKRRATKNI